MPTAAENLLAGTRGKIPSREMVKQTRLAFGLTQTQAAELVYASLSAWQRWEQGSRGISPALWELFLLKIIERFTLEHGDKK